MSEQKTNGADTRGQDVQGPAMPAPEQMAEVVKRVDTALATALQSGDPLLRLQTEDLRAVLAYTNQITLELRQQRDMVQRYAGALEEARRQLGGGAPQTVALPGREGSA